MISSGAAAEVLALAEALNIPLATSMNAKGTIVDDHRLSAGVVGTYSRGCANRTVVGADLVLFIGSHTGGQVTHKWRVPPRGTRVIQIDIDPAELGRNYVNAVSVLGDAKVATARLLDVARGEPQADRSGWIEEVGGFVKQWRAEMEPFLSSSARPMRPERICRAIGETLPPDGVVVTDTGHSGIWSSTMIDLRYPTQRFIRCAGSMGWGFPGSLGVKCALPDRPVLCWSGDGAFYYHIAELETAARYGINVVTVVNNNSSLNQEIPLFDKAYGGEQRGRADEMWRHSNIEFRQGRRKLRLRRHARRGPSGSRWRAQGSLCRQSAGGDRRGKRRARHGQATVAAMKIGTRFGTDLATDALDAIVDREPQIEQIAHGLLFGEGLVWDARENRPIWTDIIGDTIWQWKPGVGVSAFLEGSRHANGLTFDRQGRLNVAGWSARTIWRIEHDGRFVDVASHYDGKKFNSPNDIVVRSDGRIYWTDSAGGLVIPGMVGEDLQRYLDIQGVYSVGVGRRRDQPCRPGCHLSERALLLALTRASSMSTTPGWR